jgi:hypothetical protein
MDNIELINVEAPLEIQNPYLVFSTEAEAKTALEAIYSNMVEAIDSPDLLDIATGDVIEKDELTPDQAVQVNAGNRHFPVFGLNAATKAKNTESGYTTAWAVAQQTVQGKWVFQKPEDALLDGVVGATVASFDPDWFPQDAAE